MEKRKYNRLTDAQKMRRDNILADYLFNHKGAENAATKHDIANYLAAQGFPQNLNSVGDLVNRIAAQRHLPICAANGKGYYWAINKAEILATIADLEGRIAALSEHIDRLKIFLFE
jgi:uncharacterized small protein (DUF1192 family)